MTAAQFLESRRQLFIQLKPRKGSGIVPLLSTGMIGGQLEQRRNSSQRGLPILCLFLEDLAFDPLSLPEGVPTEPLPYGRGSLSGIIIRRADQSPRSA